jgi:hypothetical protein
MDCQQERTDAVLGLMRLYDKQKYKFAADQFTGAYVNRHLSRIPPGVLAALDVVNGAEKSWVGAFAKEASIELAKKALNVGFLPLGEVASLFSRNEVDLGLVEEIFAVFSPLTIFTGLKYTMGCPTLVTCVDADHLTATDAGAFADFVQEVNIHLLSNIAGEVLGKKVNKTGIHSYVIYTFFTTTNLSIIPTITTNCKRGTLFKPHHVYPICLDVPNRMSYPKPKFGLKSVATAVFE